MNPANGQKEERAQTVPNGVLAGTGVVAAASLLGLAAFATKVTVPDDSVGISHEGARVTVVSPGSYLFGSLRFPNLEIIQPERAEHQRIELTFTPGTLDKLASFGRNSIIVNLLPVIGDYTREKLTDHVKITLELDYGLPAKEKLDSLLLYAGATDVQTGIAKACYRAILPEEDAVNRRFFKAKTEKIEEIVAEYLKEKLGLDVISVKVAEVKPIKQNAGDIAVEYRSLHHEQFVRRTP